MLLHITPDRLISDIQQEFNKMFPFLKIEFFNKRSLIRGDFSAKQLLPKNQKVGDNQLVITDGNISIEDEMKVSELENIFKDHLGLAVQVFRKSGNLWLETTMTDNWTLLQQNNHGCEISTGKPMTDRAEDFDLNRDADH